MRLSTYTFIVLFFLMYSSTTAQNKLRPSVPPTTMSNQLQKVDNESLYRPQFHFTPQKGWMNDPNGLIFLNGQYHLFYQHYPDATVWGPMHWGHATSKDLVQWTHQPIALFPDSIGMIFSGSAVLDRHNTSGLGQKGIAPLVAIFTQHNMPGEKAGRSDFQNQSIAYSLDEGITWTKYAGNPVLKTPNLKDFRDPKVIWHMPSKKWIMSLAVANHIEFYSSPNLIHWTKESDIGKDQFAHGGVWECPDLLSFTDNGRTIWVLLVSMNPGGPNSGSATQYLVGDFDGHQFKPFSTQTKWMDYGPDNYAGVTFSNVGDRKILIGWMSNWNYANLVPTEKWRSALTIPRELRLVKQSAQSEDYLLASAPVKELDERFIKTVSKENIVTDNVLSIAKEGHTPKNMAIAAALPSRIDLTTLQANDFELIFSNEFNERLLIGFDATKKQFYIDRKNAGLSSFYEGFAAIPTAPRLTDAPSVEASIFIDKSSVELFADGGRTVMTALFFSTHPFTICTLQAKEGVRLKSLQLYSLK